MSSLKQWVEKAAALCLPDRVHYCDGSPQEFQDIGSLLVSKGVFVPLNPAKRPDSFWCHSHPDDVARVEENTFICSLSKENAGPTNNWKDPKEMHGILEQLFKGCMRGRTLYVIPFRMGPAHSPMAHIGVQVTDSPYVVYSMHIMTHVGKDVVEALEKTSFVPCMHSVGKPLEAGEKDTLWPCNPSHKYIVHFPEEKSIWSFGSGYGGNALLGKKCLALRIASVIAREQMWLAEHMLITGITSPQGEKKYIVGAFPSACGKTNLAMLLPALKGWKIECVGDDIAWMYFGKDGQLYAVNPEAGFFGVAPGTSIKSNLHAMETIRKNTVFTNTALTQDKDVWWEGMTPSPPAGLTSWLGKPWDPQGGTKASHPNARFTTPAKQCPIIDPHWQDPKGVPISAIIFGGRRSSTIPLVYQSLDWNHGVFVGASLCSETTAAAKGEVGKLRHDPFAMLPFCGYNMGDYFKHWIEMGKQSHKLPKIFHVNWFRKSKTGEFLWPGFGENMRVLKWILERTSGKENALETPIGYIPKIDALDTSGLTLPQDTLRELLAVDAAASLREAQEIETYFSTFGNKLPRELAEQLSGLKKRLQATALSSL